MDNQSAIRHGQTGHRMHGDRVTYPSQSPHPRNASEAVDDSRRPNGATGSDATTGLSRSTGSGNSTRSDESASRTTGLTPQRLKNLRRFLGRGDGGPLSGGDGFAEVFAAMASSEVRPSSRRDRDEIVTDDAEPDRGTESIETNSTSQDSDQRPDSAERFAAIAATGPIKRDEDASVRPVQSKSFEVQDSDVDRPPDTVSTNANLPVAEASRAEFDPPTQTVLPTTSGPSTQTDLNGLDRVRRSGEKATRPADRGEATLPVSQPSASETFRPVDNDDANATPVSAETINETDGADDAEDASDRRRSKRGRANRATRPGVGPARGAAIDPSTPEATNEALHGSKPEGLKTASNGNPETGPSASNASDVTTAAIAQSVAAASRSGYRNTLATSAGSTTTGSTSVGGPSAAGGVAKAAGGSNGGVAASSIDNSGGPAPERSGASAGSERSNGSTLSRIKLIQRVSRAFDHLRRDGGEVRMRLAPEQLGSVRVDMRVRSGTVRASVVAENENVATAIREHLPELRQRLESFGLEVERLEVRVGDDSAAPSGGRSDAEGFTGERDQGRDGRDASNQSATNRSDRSNDATKRAANDVGTPIEQLMQRLPTWTGGVDLTV